MPWDALGCLGIPWDALGCLGIPWIQIKSNRQIKPNRRAFFYKYGKRLIFCYDKDTCRFKHKMSSLFTLRRHGRVNETVGVTEHRRGKHDEPVFPRYYVPAFASVASARAVARWLPHDRLPAMTLDRADSVTFDVTDDVDRILMSHGHMRKRFRLQTAASAASVASAASAASAATAPSDVRPFLDASSCIAADTFATAPIVIRARTRLCVRKDHHFHDRRDVYNTHEIATSDALLLPFERNVGLLLPGDVIDEDDDEIRIECYEVQAWL